MKPKLVTQPKRGARWPGSLASLSLLSVLLVILTACGGAATATTAPATTAPTAAARPTTAPTSAAAATTAPTTAATTAPTAGAAGTVAAGGTGPAVPTAGASPATAGAGTIGGQAGSTNNFGLRPGAGSPVDQVQITAPVEITFWHTQTRANEEKLKAIIAGFEAQNPNIKIKAEYQGSYDDLYKKTLASLNGGGLPDVSVAYESQVSEYQAADKVLALEDYINSQRYGLSAEDLNDFYPLYITSNQYPEYQNKMLSFPFTKSVLVMYYNADKLKEAGIGVPTTWDEFAAACKKFTGDVKGYAIAVDASTFNGAVYSRGGQLINQAQTEWTFNGQQGVDFLAMNQDLVKSGCAYPIEQRFADQTAFGEGKVVFTFGSSSGLPFYQDAVSKGAKFNWSAAIIPHGAGNPPVTTSYGANIAVFKSNPQKQLAAWQFIKYFTSTAVNADWSTASGYLPIRKSAANTDVVKAQFEKVPSYRVAVNDIQQYGRPETTIRGTQDTRNFIANAWTAAITDTNSRPKQLLDEAVQKGNDALRRNR